MDREAWYSAVHGITKSQEQLSNGTELNILLYEYITFYLYIQQIEFWYVSLNNTSIIFKWTNDTESCSNDMEIFSQEKEAKGKEETGKKKKEKMYK